MSRNWLDEDEAMTIVGALLTDSAIYLASDSAERYQYPSSGRPVAVNVPKAKVEQLDEHEGRCRLAHRELIAPGYAGTLVCWHRVLAGAALLTMGDDPGQKAGKDVRYRAVQRVAAVALARVPVP